MKLETPKFYIVEQHPGMVGMFKHIELAARLSHLSINKITDNSYVEFIKRMSVNKHYSTFEHGTVYLTVDLNGNISDPELFLRIYNFYDRNKYSELVKKDNTLYITTNYRVLCENNRGKDIRFFTEPTEFHKLRHSVFFLCDMGVSRDFNRHRANSITQESTRFNNYGKGDSEITVVIPKWIREDVKEIESKVNIDESLLKSFLRKYLDDVEMTDIEWWLMSNMLSEKTYMMLNKKFGWIPQRARTVLPLDLKTEMIHTAYDYDWDHFFDLRSLGTTGIPHESDEEIATELRKIFIEKNYINDNNESL